MTKLLTPAVKAVKKNNGRKLVYLAKGSGKTVNASCPGITCPGFCACASKKK